MAENVHTTRELFLWLSWNLPALPPVFLLQMSEMEISRAVAERSLREHMGNVVEALVTLTNWADFTQRTAFVFNVIQTIILDWTLKDSFYIDMPTSVPIVKVNFVTNVSLNFFFWKIGNTSFIQTVSSSNVYCYELYNKRPCGGE